MVSCVELSRVKLSHGRVMKSKVEQSKAMVVSCRVK